MRKGIETTADSVAGAFGKAAALPAKPPRRKKHGKGSPRVTLRLSDEEHTALAKLAEGQSVSDYIRANLFGESSTRKTRRLHMPVKDQQAMARALALLGKSRMANNLNQLAHHANIGTLPIDDETRGWIEEAHSHVTAIRDALVTALGLIDQSRR